jgi:hypothetical protein
MEMCVEGVAKRALLVLLAIGVSVALAMAFQRLARTRAPSAAPPVDPRQTSIAPINSPAMTETGAVIIDEMGTYVIELATKKLWKLGNGFATSVRWLPDGGS